METASQANLPLTADRAYVLSACMEVASFHNEFDGTDEDWRFLWDRLHLIMEEHGEQGDTLEEILR